MALMKGLPSRLLGGSGAVTGRCPGLADEGIKSPTNSQQSLLI